jgi:hypothetical protein
MEPGEVLRSRPIREVEAADAHQYTPLVLLVKFQVRQRLFV